MKLCSSGPPVLAEIFAYLVAVGLLSYLLSLRMNRSKGGRQTDLCSRRASKWQTLDSLFLNMEVHPSIGTATESELREGALKSNFR